MSGEMTCVLSTQLCFNQLQRSRRKVVCVLWHLLSLLFDKTREINARSPATMPPPSIHHPSISTAFVPFDGRSNSSKSRNRYQRCDLLCCWRRRQLQGNNFNITVNDGNACVCNTVINNIVRSQRSVLIVRNDKKLSIINLRSSPCVYVCHVQTTYPQVIWCILFILFFLPQKNVMTISFDIKLMSL